MRHFLPVLLIILSSIPSHADAEKRRDEASGTQPATQPAERPKLIVSKETTYFTGPLRDDGTVDYVAALNKVYGEGVTPENNAAAALWPVLPWVTDPGTAHQAWYERAAQQLGVDPKALGDPIRWPESDTDLDDQWYESLEGPWDETDFPLAAQWLDENREKLRRVDHALDRPKFYVPLIRSDADTRMAHVLLPHLGASRVMTRGLLCRGMREVAKGDLDAALATYRTMRRLGHHMESEPTVIGVLVAVSLEGLSRPLFDAILSSPRLDRRTVAEALAVQRASPFVSRMPDVMSRSERGFTLAALQELYRGFEFDEQISSAFAKPLTAATRTRSFDVNVAMREINTYYERFGGFSQVTTFKGQRALREELEAELALMPTEFLQKVANDDGPHAERFSAGVAQVHLSIYAPGFSGAAMTQLRNAMTHELRLVAAALEAHRLEHGRYPDSLDALTEGGEPLLESLPVDRYDGRPLTYKTNVDGKGDGQTYLLYSLGSNGQDDAGVMDFSEGDIAVGRPKPRTPDDE